MRRRFKMVTEATIEGLYEIIKSSDPNDMFYQRFRKQRGAMFFKFWLKHPEWKHLIEQQELAGHIIDFGCGTGHSDILLASHGYKIHGIDNNETGIKIANYLRELQSPTIQDNISFECLELDKETPENEYDAVWSSHVFEHIEDPTSVFAGLNRLTKPKAKMLIVVPFANAFDHPTHVHHWYHTEELCQHLSRYVKVIDIKKYKQVFRVLCELGENP